MAIKKEKRPGYGKLLDAWVAPEEVGPPLGCLATSFTFDPVFFEEECLGRLLDLESDPLEDGPVYLVEREEKLRQVKCAMALVDQHHCKGSRSLRWDLLSVRLPGGVLHAKVSLLAWSGLVRVIVASANLTESGYRRNHEIYGVLDYAPQGKAPMPFLREIIAFLREVSSWTQPSGEAHSPAMDRANSFLDLILRVSSDWGIEDSPSFKNRINYLPILISPYRNSALGQLSQLWPGGGKPTKAQVLSPFFDPPDVLNEPATELWNSVLRRRGNATVSYHVTGEDVSGEDAILLHAPEALKKAQPKGRPGTSTEFYRVTLETDRPLHAKAIWLEDDRWILYFIGSSNFTRAGLGLNSKACNLEANIAYIVDTNRNQKARSSLIHAFLKGTFIKKIKWPKHLENEDTTEGASLLPIAFGVAIYDLDEAHGPSIRLQFSAPPPSGWVLLLESDDSQFFDESMWITLGRPESFTLPWTRKRPPSGFWVFWNGAIDRAWWPVNVASANCLPPPDVLKDLSLEILIDVLTSARPLHLVLKAYLKTQEGDSVKWEVLTDPHKRVDTSQFLLQRTRRVSWALAGLRERLERPTPSEESLDWRLRGPIGILALAKALKREARSEEEVAFLISELVLELSRVQPKEATGCLSAQTVRQAINSLIPELKHYIPDMVDGALEKLGNLKRYTQIVFQQVAP